jgi:hypothetical protein
MTGKQYADAIATYLVRNYGSRGLRVYREVALGKTIIAKTRKVDIFAIVESTREALAIECKFQDSQGTTDEKIPYALQDLEALPVPGCIVYTGAGFSQGILHMLEASPRAARCFAEAPDFRPSLTTWELDHLLAVTFRWWDLVVRDKREHTA